MKLIKKLIVSAFWEKDGVTGLEDGLETAGVVGRDILGEGITRGVFESVLTVLAEVGTCEFGLGILDGWDLLGVLGDDDVTTLGGGAPRINKHFLV
jgi:hypothetical protein